MVYITIINILVLVVYYFYIRILWIKRFEMVVLQRSPPMFTRLPPFFEMVFKKPFEWKEETFLPDIENLRYE